MSTASRLAALTILVAAAACSPQGAANPNMAPTPFAETGPRVYIANLTDGETVSSPVRVMFGLSGYGVAPSGVDKPNTGHHHLFIDATEVTAGAPIPSDEHHVHFGGGQTETVVNLDPGEHTLMLVLADRNHVPFDPSIQSEPITITVR